MNEKTVVTLDELAAGGDAVARHSGKVVFVEDGCPGDEAEIEFTRRGKHFDKARIARLLAPSQKRVAAGCPLFGRCGGCQWQHVDIAEQRAQKRNMLAQNLKRLAKAEPPDIAIVAGEPFGYRVKARLIADGRGDLGFREAKSHRICDAAPCKILDERLMDLLPAIKRWTAAHRIAGEVQVGVGSAGAAVQIIAHVSQKSLEALLADEPRIIGAMSTDTAGESASTGTLHLEQTGGDRWPAIAQRIDSFWQANAEANRLMLARISDLALQAAAGETLELFAGSGNLTRALLARNAPLVAVEVEGPACASLEHWAQANDAPVEVWRMTAEEGLLRAIAEGRTFPLVVLDPPRAGLGQAVNDLVKLAPADVIYLSCDSATLARDCRVLVEAGYRVESAAMLDFFPQTHHIESLLWLRRHP